MARRFTNFENKKKLFYLYANNIYAIFRKLKVNESQIPKNIFICPICLRVFSEEEFLNDKGKTITLEHIPPIKLKSRRTTLTCADCNNKAGTNLDSHIINKLIIEDFLLGYKDIKVNTKIILNNDAEINGYANYLENRHLNLVGIPENSNPSELKKIFSIKNDGNLAVTIKFSGGFKKGHPEAGLLRIAYLWIFSIFGYGFLINNNLFTIREQINNPSEEILPNWGIITNFDIPDRFLGVNLISSPLEVRSFCVIFDLKTSNRKIRYGVLLPGYKEPGIDIYKINPMTSLRLHHIQEIEELLSNEILCFSLQYIWEYWHRNK